MNQKKLTQLIEESYKSMDIKTETIPVPITIIKPIINLSKDQECSLLNGDGQSNPLEYKQINSSTGLAVNYFKILESTEKISNLVFENKVEKPLKSKGGKPANLDVSYLKDGILYYVESKFLEPYYSSNEHNRDAYFVKENYDVHEEHKNDWLKLLETAQQFKLYNFSQICRHLMAIWRKHKDDDQKIVFRSVTWKMSDSFIEKKIDSKYKEDCIARRNEIEKESKRCNEVVNIFLNKIGWNSITFECLYYDDILDDIKESKDYEEFKKRYFID
ncbi:MAG: hypothetical protein J6Y99_02520 [Bacteroidales bacterium]|nr:hypothetical protein [Bacteroidales bacterium]